MATTPSAIQFTNANVTKYVYSATGDVIYQTSVYPEDADIVKIGKTKELTPEEINCTETVDYLLGGSLVMRNGKIDKVLFDGGYAQASVTTKTTDKFAFNFYNQDHLGNNREVVDAKGVVQQVTNYYPFGAPYADATAVKGANLQPYKYNGKELDRMHGLNTYDYGARQHDPILCRWDRMDPLSHKYYSTSPYAYCANNPVNAIDPDGRYTKVIQKEDGTYEVIGGELDGDNNIYLYSNGERGASIGQSVCETSFYNSDAGTWQVGAIIDPNDKSGQEFLDKMSSTSITLPDYVDKARNDHPYDFKVTNGKGEKHEGIETYRGMLIKGHDGNNIYASARDVGNIAAGMIAAKNGLSWTDARLGFDGYQSWHDRKFKMEGISTQNAEWYGFNYKFSVSSKINNLGYSIGGAFLKAERYIRGLWKK